MRDRTIDRILRVIESAWVALAVLAVVLAVLSFTGGCAPSAPTGGTISGGSAITYNDAARHSLLPLKKHPDKVVAQKAADVSWMLDQQKPLIESMTAEILTLSKWKVEVWDDWMGPRLKRAGWWAIGLITGSLVTWFLLAAILLNVGGGFWLRLGKWMYSPIGKILSWAINGITGGPRVIYRK